MRRGAANAFVLAMACGALGPEAGAQPLRLAASVQGDELIVEAAGPEEGSAPLLRATWRGVAGGRPAFSMQRLSSPEEGERLLLDRLAEAAIGAYLDAHVHFTKQGVRADAPADALAAAIDGLADALAQEAGSGLRFAGLSPSTRQQLDRLTRIDWSKAAFGVEGGAEQEKYLAVYYYVRTQRQELERQLRADLLPLSDADALAAPGLPPGRTVPVESTCGTVFDEDNYLCALDLRVADSGNGLGADPLLSGAALRSLSERAAAAPAAPQPEARIRKRDRWLKQELDAINGRIDRMDQRRELWELRDRMDDIEDRLTGLELDVREARQQGMPDNPSASLAVLTGRNITVRFARGSMELEPDERVLLNEVFEQLARSPEDKVLITGYTDRSGDAGRNLRLSEQRAKAVRGYLLARGISAERLLVNYYGDSRSLGRDPSERRVEVEWIR